MAVPEVMRAFAAAALALVASVGLGLAETSVGRATVVDGDTLDIRGRRFRLQGVDTPESAQLCRDAAGKDYRCGQRAALALADKIGASNIECEPVTTDKYGRTVALCFRDGEDLQGWLVEQGLGIAYRKYSTAYVPQEEAARAAKRGLWAGTFTPPWDWRKGERTGPEGQIGGSANTPTVECAIKGNINRKGERIYHLPGSTGYEKTVITEASGERMFCSTDDAKKAGWRAARSR